MDFKIALFICLGFVFAAVKPFDVKGGVNLFGQNSVCRCYKKHPFVHPAADPVQKPVAGECKVTQLGREYRGTLSKTKSGYTCQAWSSQQPHQHSNTPQNYPKAGLMNNYCRNPDNEPGGPWCYTTSATERWESCDVKLCGSAGRNLTIEQKKVLVDHFIRQDFQTVHFSICFCTKKKRTITLLTMARHAQIKMKSAIKKVNRMKCRKAIMLRCKMPNILRCRIAEKSCRLLKKRYRIAEKRCRLRLKRRYRMAEKRCRMAKIEIRNIIRRKLIKQVVKSVKYQVPKSILQHLPAVLDHDLKNMTGFKIGLQGIGPLFPQY